MSVKLSKESFKPVDENIEISYANFYFSFLKQAYNFENQQLVKRIKDAFYTSVGIRCSATGVKKTAASQIQYHSKESRCAYVYLYGVLHSKMVSFHFTNFLRVNISRTRHILCQNSLKICCLGGGPALEAVSIVKVLSDLMLRTPSVRITDIHISVVDKYPKWEEEFITIFELMKENESLGIRKDININVEFLKANLLKEIDNNLKKKVVEADIVTMVKLIPDLKMMLPVNTDERIRNVLQKVADNVKENGFFFAIDNGGGGIPGYFRHVFNRNMEFRKLKGSEAHERHCLHENTIRQFETLLPRCRCAKETLVYSCAWQKRKPNIVP